MHEDAKFLWVFLFMCFSTRIYSEQPFYLKILMVLFQLHVCLYSIWWNPIKFSLNPWLGKDLLCYYIPGKKNWVGNFKKKCMVFDWLTWCSNILPEKNIHLQRYKCVNWVVMVILFLTKSVVTDIYFYSNWHHHTS